MKAFLTSFALLIFLSAGAGITGEFPVLKSENLNQREVSLPAEFNARRSILFIAYKQNQQPAVDSWNPFLADVTAEYSDVKYFELPTLGSGNSLFRGFIDGGMRSGITDPAVRERTITLYTDVGKFQAALGLSGTAAIDVLVIDKTGKVLAKAAGVYTAEAANIIEAALN